LKNQERAILGVEGLQKAELKELLKNLRTYKDLVNKV